MATPVAAAGARRKPAPRRRSACAGCWPIAAPRERWSCCATRSASPSRCSAPSCLMLVFGYGITFDVEQPAPSPCSTATRRRRAAPTSRSFAGSRYFDRDAAASPATRRWTGGCATASYRLRHRDPARLRPRPAPRPPDRRSRVWIDGAMPFRAETTRGYVEGVHQHYLADLRRGGRARRRQPGAAARDPLPLQPGLQERLRHGARRSSRCCWC